MRSARHQHGMRASSLRSVFGQYLGHQTFMSKCDRRSAMCRPNTKQTYLVAGHRGHVPGAAGAGAAGVLAGGAAGAGPQHQRPARCLRRGVHGLSNAQQTCEFCRHRCSAVALTLLVLLCPHIVEARCAGNSSRMPAAAWLWCTCSACGSGVEGPGHCSTAVVCGAILPSSH